MNTASANTTTEKKSASLLSALDSLLAASEAFKNVRAILLLGLTFICAVVVGVGMSFIATKGGGVLFSILGVLMSLIILFYGGNAVGIMLMREAHGDMQNDVASAIMQSLSTSHRLIGVALLAFLIMLAAYLVVALILFICKVPFLGAVLFTVAFPVSVIFLGLLMFSLFYIMMPLAGPSVWSGSTTMQAIARLITIAKTKLVSVILHQFILFFIVMFVMVIVFGVVILGFAITAGMSAGIIGTASFNFNIPGGTLIGGAIGFGVLYALVLVIPALIATKGMCIIYLNAIEGLDFGHAEAQLESGMAAVKKKAEEARERAQQMAEQHSRQNPGSATSPVAAVPVPAAPAAAAPVAPAASATSGPAAPSAPTTPTAPAAPAAPLQAVAPPARPAATNCPSCHVPVSSDDAFCGNCGHKLK